MKTFLVTKKLTAIPLSAIRKIDVYMPATDGTNSTRVFGTAGAQAVVHIPTVINVIIVRF